jgi:hypothetical protein
VITVAVRSTSCAPAASLAVGYRQDGNSLASFTPFAGSKNLRGDADVEVLLRGEQRYGAATVVTDPELGAPALRPTCRLTAETPGSSR